MNPSPYLAILSTGTALTERITRAEKVWALYLATCNDDLDLIALESPVPFLSCAERAALRVNGWLLLLFSTEDAAMHMFEQVSGDDGHSQSNPYKGPHYVYAFVSGPQGGITENT